MKTQTPFFSLISLVLMGSIPGAFAAEGRIDREALAAMTRDPGFSFTYCPQLEALRDAAPTASPHTVVFCIPKDSGARPWNSMNPAAGEIGMVELKPGQVLRVLNFDENEIPGRAKHLMHTTLGEPCSHPKGPMESLKRDGAGDILEVDYFDCPIGVASFEPLDRYGRARVYDHFDGPNKAPFFIRVTP